jgi:hypothetical protein
VVESTGGDGRVDFFEGLECEAPSVAVERRILAVARVRLAAGRRARRRKWLAAGGLAAGVLLAVTVSLSRPRPSGEPGKVAAVPEADSGDSSQEATSSALVPSPALRSALKELRADLEEIDEMTTLVDPGRKKQKETLVERVRACLADLARLEKRVSGTGESVLVPPGKAIKPKEDKA